MPREKQVIPPTGLARRICETRVAASVSMRDSAELLGVSHQTVFSWERGLHEPSAGALKAICEAYGVSSDWLLFGDGYDERETEVPVVEPGAIPTIPAPSANDIFVDLESVAC